MNELELLRASRTWLLDADHWCQGRMVDWGHSPDAFPNHPRRACATGAIAVIGHGEPTAVRGAAQDRLKDAAEALYACSPPHANDTLGYAAVIAIYDAAVLAAALDQVRTEGRCTSSELLRR